jgi:Holliday junction resolvasome RuvABC endonuclease subunit
MIRMGLDGSTKCSGWCIFHDDKLLYHGKIIADKNLEWRERVVYMMNQIAILIKEYKVEELCVELPVKTIANVNTLEQLFSLHGAILGVASALHIKFTPVNVNTWRKELGLLTNIPKGTKDKRSILKERSVNLANELYDLNLVWKSKASKDNDDDISDAILIAHTVIHK